MIIVTGSAGFIGSQIALDLAKQNHHLVCVDRLAAFDDRKYIDSQESEKIKFIEANEIFLSELPRLRNVEWIIHMGAITNTAEKDWDELKKWNVEYSKALWNHCTKHKMNFIYASSAATYGDGTQGFSDAHDKIKNLKPLNLYGRSKQEFDLFVLAQKETPPHWYGLKYFNIYGPNENHKARMASAIWHGYKEISKTGTMTLFRSHNAAVKDGDQARDFFYIADVLKIVSFMRKKTPANGIYNLGSGRAQTFKELSDCLFTAMKRPIKINYIDTPVEFRAAYQYRTEAEVEKLRSAGYTEAFTTLADGARDYLKYLK